MRAFPSCVSAVLVFDNFGTLRDSRFSDFVAEMGEIREIHDSLRISKRFKKLSNTNTNNCQLGSNVETRRNTFLGMHGSPTEKPTSIKSGSFSGKSLLTASIAIEPRSGRHMDR